MNKVLLGGILIVAFILRCVGLSYGLPHLYYSDESHHIYWALNMGGGNLNPNFFVHPTLFFYMLLFADVVFITLGLFTGLFKTPGDAWLLYQTDSTVFFLLARAVSVFFGMATILVTYFTGKKVFGQKTGLVAAFFLAFTYIHVQYSQIGFIDSTLTFFISLAVFLALEGFKNGKFFPFIGAGIAAGLSCSLKYSGGVLLLIGPVALLARAYPIQSKEAVVKLLLDQRLLFFTLAFLVGFSFGTPYWILDFKTFSKDLFTFSSIFKPQGLGHFGHEGSLNWLYYLSHPLSYGLGKSLEWLSLIGCFFLLLIARKRINFVLFVFPMVYFILLGKSDVRAARYILPIVPFLCIAAAGVLQKFKEWFSMRNIKLSLVFWVFCCFVIMTPSFLSIFKHHQLSMTVDTRTLLREWLLKNIGSADRFLYSLDTFIPPKDFPDQSIAIDGGLFDVRTGHVSTLKPLREYKRDGFDYIILDEWHEQVALDAFLYNPKRKDISDRYRVFRNEINETAELVAEFTPYYNTSDRFDLENVDFLSTGLWQRKSMGPRIRVYKL